MNIERLVLGPLDTNCYLVSASADSPLLVIDPAGDAEDLLAAIGVRDVALIVLTHCHFDHLGAASRLAESCGAGIAVHEDDADFITDPVGTGGSMWGFDAVAPPASRLLVDGDALGPDGLELTVIATPGHTPGSICLEGSGHVFTGDTLFAGSVGRTDFPRGDSGALVASIRDKLVPLDDAQMIHPGHGPDSTIGRERRVNPFFPRRR